MDGLTHLIMAAAVTTDPLAIVFAVLPDAPLANAELKRARLPAPPTAYLWTHSFWPVIALAFFWPDAAFCWWSHIVLDIMTHDRVFAPRLLYPLPWRMRAPFGEWEYFNRSWFLGAGVTLCMLGWRISGL